MPFLELEDYEREARELRKLLRIDDQARPDMVTIIVKLKRLGLIENYERVPDRQMPEDEAQWDPDTRLIRLRESVFRGANQLLPNPRSRWTIAHEIGHMWRGHTKARHRNVSGRSIERIAAPIRKDERQADGIAAAFLAPSHLVQDPFGITVERIVALFNISPPAAKTRKSELERMYRRANGILRPLPASISNYLASRKK